MSHTNFLLSNYTISGSSAVSTSDMECDAGEQWDFEVLIESVNGSPTAASLSAKFQVAPIEFRGFNLNWFTSGAQLAWMDVEADGYNGNLLIDGAWPSPLADQTLVSQRAVSRRIRIPALCRLVRLVLTPSFSGGTSPHFKVTVAAALPGKA